MNDFTSFRAVYDELTDAVTSARHQFVADHLSNWFRHLDETPGVSTVIQRLQNQLDFAAWYKEQGKSVSSFVGSGKLKYPTDREKSLGMRLLLFREFAEERMKTYQFALNFVYTRNNLDELSHNVIEQIFVPMARELRRSLESEAQKPDFGKIPASDRNVTVDHNSKGYIEADEAMANLERAIREANDFDDPLEKEQREAEISAARRLMKATRVALEPLAALIGPTLKQFADSVKNALLASAAKAVTGKLIALFGAALKWFLNL